MSKRRKSKRVPTRKIVFNTSLSFDKELFFNIAMEIIGSCDVVIEARLGRIMLQIKGNLDQVDRIVSRLLILEGQLNRATNSTDGYFYYEKELISQVFHNQLQLKYFAQAIAINGYDAHIDGTTLVTTASLNDLQNIHPHAVNLLHQAPSSMNKDIRRFLSIFAIKTKQNHETVIHLARKHQIIKEKDSNFHFTMDVHDAYHKMNTILDKDDQTTRIDHKEKIRFSSSPELSMTSEFEGGKIVFIKNGKEQDSNIDVLLNNQSINENKKKLEDSQ